MRLRRRAIVCAVFVVVVGLLGLGVSIATTSPNEGYVIGSTEIQEDENSGQIIEGYIYFNESTGEYERMSPLPITEPVDEAYIRVEVTKTTGPVGEEVMITPSNNSNTDYLLIDSEKDGTFKRLTIDCAAILGVSELVYRGPVYIQVDIQMDGEWVFGCHQELNNGEACQIVLPKRSPFRCYLWKPEGNDWVCRFSYTSRWW